ncbi:Uncharacterised protein [Vibrio cholerae]|nr:Uncharacterised protein [Vibrio cholerae]CSB01627.1 Uncharacterised protein [Vibrio cholerae]CSB55885.1 Uncharacterised protein [Vibrio cholerae]CSB88242.1 Uncharacterised protein [Vibrio cholerae]CSC21878.1 Uncharacterised protein [Vibrio cholerae]
MVRSDFLTKRRIECKGTAPSKSLLLVVRIFCMGSKSKKLQARARCVGCKRPSGSSMIKIGRAQRRSSLGPLPCKYALSKPRSSSLVCLFLVS